MPSFDPDTLIGRLFEGVILACALAGFFTLVDLFCCWVHQLLSL